MDKWQERRLAERLARKHWSIEEIQKAHEDEGWYFFSADSKRFFRSRIGSDVFTKSDGSAAFFITSEQNGDGPRLFTVRRFDVASADVRTEGEFQAYKSRGGALAAAKRAAQA